jgi:hypothetical protein
VRITVLCAVIGGGLGALVAVVAHFMSHTLPTHYTVGFWQMSSGDSLDPEVNLGSPPLVHPSWWPSLPLAIGIGLLLGAALGVAAGRAGLSFSVKRTPRP